LTSLDMTGLNAVVGAASEGANVLNGDTGSVDPGC
jgi:hypothetical protein